MEFMPRIPPADLLGRLPVGKNVFQHNIKLSHVVLAEAVLVPTRTLYHDTVDIYDGELESLVPFWIEGAIDRGGCLTGVAHGDNEILRDTKVSSLLHGTWRLFWLTGSLVPLRSLAARSRPCILSAWSSGRAQTKRPNSYDVR